MAKRTTKKVTGLSYGTSGAAKLTKIDDTKARIDFESGESVNLVVKQGDVFEQDTTATLPEYVPFKSMKQGGVLSVRVSLAEGNSKVLFMNPLSGTYTVKFIGFSANPPEGFVPAWTEEENKWGKVQRRANPFVEFVSKGERWFGCKIRGRLIDKFGKDPDDGNTTIWEEERGTHWKNLEDFCNCVGYQYWEEPYTENNLPQIQDIGVANGNEFQVVLNNGYISSWIPPLTDEAFEDEEFAQAMQESERVNEEVNELLKD